MDRYQKGSINLEQFKEIIESWGFAPQDKIVKEVFDWLDNDKDEKISFLDLKQTIGYELMPQEHFYFRQDVAPSKKLTCKYPECWENTRFDQKSAYCPLHQKFIRSQVIDMLEDINKQISDHAWQNFRANLQRTNYVITIGKFETLLQKYAKQTTLSAQDKEYIYEAFKSTYDEQGRPVPDMDGISDLSTAALDQKLIILTKLERLRNDYRGKRTQELISLDEDGADIAARRKAQGLK